MLEKNPTKLALEDLESLYTEAEACDKRVFAEMRTNLQLVAGEHYVKEGSRYWSRIRDNKQLSDEQRLKLTKNHIQRIAKIYINSILSSVPGVAVTAKDEKSLQHQKAAELHYAVVQDWNEGGHFSEQIEEWTRNFFEIGEVAAKVFWEADDGKVMGYEAISYDEEGEESETGEYDLEGEEPKPNEDKPVYSGKIVFETVHGFNLKRDPDVGSFKESPYVIVTKMTSLSALKARLSDDAFNKMKNSTSGSSSEYTVFDNNTGQYRQTKNQVLVKEIYFRPNPKIPKGYFYIFNSETVLAEGDLPYGLFPIVYEACEQQTGNARGHSFIRHIRPCQIELNRCASKVAEHQITIGDDKVFIPSTSKMVQGAMLPGIRVNTYSGQQPIILAGRTGDQYLPYMTATVDEMYKLAELDEVVQDLPADTDIYTQLFRSLKYKKKFVYYSDKIERFIVRVVELGLKLTKECIPDEALIPAIGKNEYINISELKNSDELCHRIKVEPRSDDIESQMGKQLQINHFLQYAGSNINRQDIGMAMRVSPFLNKEQMFEDFTLDYDNVTNDILALDRGQQRPPRKSDDDKYICKKLSSRMSKEDFNLLPPGVQQNYQTKLQMHEQAIAQKAQELKQAESQFIPSGGYMVAMDYYVSEPGGDPNKTRRVRVPSESVAWLLDILQKQGNQMNDLTQLPPGVTSDIAGQMNKGPGQPGPATPGPQHMGPMGQASPGGMNHAGIRQPGSGIPGPGQQPAAGVNPGGRPF